MPPLLLGRVIDRLTAGLPLTFLAVLLYFGSLALEGVFSSAQESLLVLFGQKMTHALRSEMSRKLTRLPAGTLAGQNPGQVAAHFSGDVDTVEAVAAVSGQVPETLHNIRTIRALGIETYRERRYDRCIGDSYAAMERTNFYDAVYSPVVLLLNAVVVGAVMLLSASGKAEILRLFGMSVGTSVAVISYISRIFAPIESLGMEIRSIQSAMAGVKRIDAIQALPEGYDTVCTDGMFSQGEWQLLSIARAAASDPAVLLLDEITANLDAETEERVLDALRQASRGRTVLSVSHRVYESLGGRTVEIKARTP